MTATAHALVGGAIAASIPNPALGITLSAASHPLLDLIPHWDFGWGWREKTKQKLFLEAAGDTLFGLVLSFFLFGMGVPLWYFLACVGVSLIWDVAEAPYWFLNWRRGPAAWIYGIQSSMQAKTKTVRGGILTQIGTCLLIIVTLQFLSH